MLSLSTSLIFVIPFFTIFRYVLRTVSFLGTFEEIGVIMQ